MTEDILAHNQSLAKKSNSNKNI